MALDVKLQAISALIDDLDDLPADHEPTTEILWDALRDIQSIICIRQEHRK